MRRQSEFGHWMKRIISESVRAKRSGSPMRVLFLSAAVLLFCAGSAEAQKLKDPPVRIGPPGTGTLVYSNTAEGYDHTGGTYLSQDGAGLNGGTEFGDDLHFTRAGNLTGVRITLQFRDESEPSLAGITVHFYDNDAADQGRQHGDLNLLVDPICSITVPTQAITCQHTSSNGACTTVYAISVDVDSIALPKDVWITVFIPNMGDAVLIMSSGTEVGSSHPLTYFRDGFNGARFLDFGSANFDFAVRMEPTPADTPLGPVTVEPEPTIDVTFADVTQAGLTEVTTSDTTEFPDANFEFLGVFYDISTTAGFSGNVEVCIDYSVFDLMGLQENSLQLLHYDGTAWVDITSSNDTTANVICGLTSSFSPFAVAHRLPHPAQELIPLLMNAVSGLNVKQGIANSLDAKLDTVTRALADLNDNNNASAAGAMAAFINEVEAQRDVQISGDDADTLILAAVDILLLLE